MRATPAGRKSGNEGKSMKKWIALLLCLATLVTLLTGCGKKEETVSDQPGASTSGDAAADGVTITIGLPRSALVTDYDNNAFTNWLEEQTGYNIQFQYFQASTSDAKTQLSTMMVSGEKLPDILYNFQLSDDLIKEYGDDGYFLDLRDYYADREGASKVFWERLQEIPEEEQVTNVRRMTDVENGAMYSLPCIQTSDIDTMDYQMWINQTWLDELNLQAPTNPDELYEVLKAFKQRDPDCVPLAGIENSMGGDVINWIVNMFTYCDDTRRWNVDENGKLYMPYTTDDYRQALIYMHKLVQEGLMTPLCWTIKIQEMQALTSPADNDPMVGIFAGHLTLHVTPGSEVLYNYKPLDLFGNAVINENINRRSTFITTDCENPDAAFALAMALYSKEAGWRLRYGEQGVNWDYADAGTESYLGKPAEIKILDDPFAKLNSCLWGDMAASLLTDAEGESAEKVEGTDAWADYKNTIVAEQVANYHAAAEANNPKTLCPPLIQTTQEKDEILQIKSDVLTIINKCRAQFANGELDPNDDAAWNDYLAQLDTLGLAQYQAQSQAIYDRQLGE